MVFSQFESTDAGQVASAGQEHSQAASSRMLAEVQNNQASYRSNAAPENAKCLAVLKQQLSEMLDGFAVDDQTSFQSGTATGRAAREGQAGLTEKEQQKLRAKPWRPEFGVCAPGSPYKIDCHDGKGEAQAGN